MTKKTLNNIDQESVIEDYHGPARVIAGPGSGKTETVIRKIMHIIDNGEAAPEEILVITFTNKAVNEVKERLIKKDYDMYGEVNVFTYHSWCHRLIREASEQLENIKNDFTIFADDEIETRVNRVIRDLGYSFFYRDIKEQFENLTRKSIDINKLKKSNNKLEIEIANLWEKFDEYKEDKGLLNFEDLLTKANKILDENDSIRQEWLDKYKFVFIDEFQDTNDLQFDLIKKITNEDSNITIVGDADQNIYSWRGANLDLFINGFTNYYSNVQKFELKTNYRSTPEIIEVANKLISNNKMRVEEFAPVAHSESGEEVEFWELPSDEMELKMITHRILEIKKEGKIPLNEVAVIVRKREQIPHIERVLLKNGLDVKLTGLKGFFAKEEVRSTLKILLFIAKTYDEDLLEDIINLPPRGYGDHRALKTKQAAHEAGQTIWEYLLNNIEMQGKEVQEWIKSTSKFIERINSGENIIEALKLYLKEIQYIEHWAKQDDEKVENIKTLLDVLERTLNKSTSKEELTELIIETYNNLLIANTNDEGDDENKVNIITAHSSKGTEFDVVIIPTLCLNTWLLWREREDIVKVEEERRVLYVAVTRARKKLILSTNTGRNMRNFPKEISAFYHEMKK